MNDKHGPTLGKTISQMELSASNHHFEERSICLTYYCICWWCNLRPAEKKGKRWKVAKLHIGVCCRANVWNICRALRKWCECVKWICKAGFLSRVLDEYHISIWHADAPGCCHCISYSVCQRRCCLGRLWWILSHNGRRVMFVRRTCQSIYFRVGVSACRSLLADHLTDV